MVHLLLAAALAIAASFGVPASHNSGGHPALTTQDCTGDQCPGDYSGGGPAGG